MMNRGAPSIMGTDKRGQRFGTIATQASQLSTGRGYSLGCATWTCSLLVPDCSACSLLMDGGATHQADLIEFGHCLL